MLSPLVFPALITGVALLQLFATTAVDNTPLNMLIAHVLVTAPYVVRTVTASLTLADITLEDAARTLGAGRWRVFRRITMPQIAPGLAAGALFAFMVSFDNFPISLWLADAQHNPMPLLVFQLIGNVFDAVDRGDVDPDDPVRDGRRHRPRAGRRIAPRDGDVDPFSRQQQEHTVRNSLDRRTFLTGAAALAAPLIIGRRASAADRSITVGIYTGQQGDIVRKQIIPPFEAKHQCKVYTTQGVTLEQIALMRATRNNPKYSVMFIDDIGVELAKREGLIEQLPRAEIPNMERLLKRFNFYDGFGAAFAMSAAGMAYNTATGKPLLSYGELWDPR